MSHDIRVKLLALLHQRQIRFQEKDGFMWVARPKSDLEANTPEPSIDDIESGDAAAHRAIRVRVSPNGTWRDNMGTEGRGYFALCQHLNIPLDTSVSVI